MLIRLGITNLMTMAASTTGIAKEMPGGTADDVFSVGAECGDARGEEVDKVG